MSGLNLYTSELLSDDVTAESVIAEESLGHIRGYIEKVFNQIPSVRPHCHKASGCAYIYIMDRQYIQRWVTFTFRNVYD